ncbi:peptidyl-prolyl cis-trans isomerase D [Prevotellaceae bacterium MN60]|nr:peptidyl-prolyl cis-trans isomerase D [Prevotellaceae bacterium MN60]
MAAIGKIRSWGPVLATVIGLALFAFIAEEMFRSCEATSNERRQQVGEVLGKKISVQDFQSLVDEYQEVIKMTQGRDNLSEEELNQVKDQVWQQFVNNTIIETEAKKLGLTVTDEELQSVLKAGTNSMLMQTPFVNQQTGLFDVSQLTKFLADYKKMQEQGGNAQVMEQYTRIYNYWKFIEKNLRQQMLAQKYQSLLAQVLFTNPISAKMAFNDQNEESDILLATVPYSAIKDGDVQVNDADLKAKYDEKKEMFKQYVESRDIKYVDFQVVASKADRDALMKTMKDAQQKLESGVVAGEVVRKAQSQVAYTGIAATRNAFPNDIAAKLDSMQVGQVTAPFETAYDNTLNVVKLISKVQLPDSVEYRQIQVGGATAEEARKTADSIYTALNGGADFEVLAKKYGQTGEKQWMTSAMYERAQTVDDDTKAYINALNTLGAGESKNLEFTSGNIVLQVTNRKAMVNKYDVAVVKHTIDFSKSTYSSAYNNFSQYVSENKTLEDLEKNAQKFGLRVQERNDLYSSEHNVAGLRATRETMKWIFDAKAGDVSPLYECGNNDHLLVVALTGVHSVGYRDMESVKEQLKAEVIRDKKFEKAAAQLAGVKDIATAKQKGAIVDSVRQITFAAPVFVQSAGASEPALSGAVAATKQGQFSASVVKGNGGAYLFQVLSKKKREGVKMDEKQQTMQLKQQAQQAASRFMNELYLKADVVDNRYLFF